MMGYDDCMCICFLSMSLMLCLGLASLNVSYASQQTKKNSSAILRLWGKQWFVNSINVTQILIDENHLPDHFLVRMTSSHIMS
jgi:hypothetical protein